MMDKLEIPMPGSRNGWSIVEEALETAHRIGYPVMVRPSYVLGGRGMEVVYDDEALTFYMQAGSGCNTDRPILIDRFLHHATGVKRTQSAMASMYSFLLLWSISSWLVSIPATLLVSFLPRGLDRRADRKTLKDYTRKIAKELHVVGLMNMQYD